MAQNFLDEFRSYDFKYWWRCAGSNRSLKTSTTSVYMFSKVVKFHLIATQLPKATIKLRFKISP